jgi:tetratricopeptide (TPR) repeat protein
MTDLLWLFPNAEFPHAVYDWQRMTTDLTYRGKGPRLTLWPFQGEQPLASGLSALFGEFFRWRGTDYQLLTTRYGQADSGDLTWDASMLQIAPANFAPSHVVGSAQLWGEYTLIGSGAATLQITYQYQDDTQTWQLEGELASIIDGLIGIVPQVLGRLGIRTDSDWQPEEPIDLTDSAALANLLAAWGELNIRHELISTGFDEYSAELEAAIQRMLDAALVGSRFACWAATHALALIACDVDAPQQGIAQDALVSLGSVYPRVAWPTVVLGLIAWQDMDYEHASALLESAVEADPRLIASWNLLALLYEDMNEFDRAEEVCREALKGNITHPTIYFRLGVLLLDHAGDDPDADEARVREAINLLTQAEAQGLADPSVPLRLMDAYEALDETDALWAAFERVLAYDRDGLVIWQIVEDADTYEEFDPALERMEKHLESKPAYDLAAAVVHALNKLDRRDEAAARIPRLRELAADDDYAKAETAQLALEAADPDFEDSFDQIQSDLEEGLIPDSSIIDFLHDAIAKEPTFADGAVALAESYSARDESEAAMLVLNEALKQLPDHLELILAKADLLWETDHDAEAEALLLETEQRHPEDVALLARLAEYYHEAGNDERSMDYIDRAEVIDPRNPELQRVQEHIMLSLAADYEELDEDEQ